MEEEESLDDSVSLEDIGQRPGSSASVATSQDNGEAHPPRDTDGDGFEVHFEYHNECSNLSLECSTAIPSPAPSSINQDGDPQSAIHRHSRPTSKESGCRDGCSCMMEYEDISSGDEDDDPTKRPTIILHTLKDGTVNSTPTNGEPNLTPAERKKKRDMKAKLIKTDANHIFKLEQAEEIMKRIGLTEYQVAHVEMEELNKITEGKLTCVEKKLLKKIRLMIKNREAAKKSRTSSSSILRELESKNRENWLKLTNLKELYFYRDYCGVDELDGLIDMGDVQLPLANLFPPLKSDQAIGKNSVPLAGLRIPPLPQRPFLRSDPSERRKKQQIKPSLDRRKRVSKKIEDETKCPLSPIDVKPDPDPLPEPRATRSSTMKKLAESSSPIKPRDSIIIKKETGVLEKPRKHGAEEPKKVTKVGKVEADALNIEPPRKASKTENEKPSKPVLLKTPEKISERVQRKKIDPKAPTKSPCKDPDEDQKKESPPVEARSAKSKTVSPPKFDISFYSGAECIKPLKKLGLKFDDLHDIDMKKLNRLIKKSDLTKEEIKLLKSKRRTLKNRHYATKSRRKKSNYLSDLKRQNEALESEIQELSATTFAVSMKEISHRPEKDLEKSRKRRKVHGSLVDTRVPLAKLQPLTKVAEIISPKRKRRHHHHGVSSVDIKPVIPLVTAEPSEFQMVVVGSSDILEPVAIPVALPLALEATIEGTIEGTIELKTTSEGTINATIEGDLPTNQPIVLNLDTRSLLEVYNQSEVTDVSQPSPTPAIQGELIPTDIEIRDSEAIAISPSASISSDNCPKFLTVTYREGGSIMGMDVVETEETIESEEPMVDLIEIPPVVVVVDHGDGDGDDEEEDDDMDENPISKSNGDVDKFIKFLPPQIFRQNVDQSSDISQASESGFEDSNNSNESPETSYINSDKKETRQNIPDEHLASTAEFSWEESIPNSLLNSDPEFMHVHEVDTETVTFDFMSNDNILSYDTCTDDERRVDFGSKDQFLGHGTRKHCGQNTAASIEEFSYNI